MSNFDLLWNESQRAAALQEGWELGVVIDEGKPIHSAYFDVFDKGPAFQDKRQAMAFVIERAKTKSRLHIAALSACQASRMHTAPRRKKK